MPVDEIRDTQRFPLYGGIEYRTRDGADVVQSLKLYDDRRFPGPFASGDQTR